MNVREDRAIFFPNNGVGIHAKIRFQLRPQARRVANGKAQGGFEIGLKRGFAFPGDFASIRQRHLARGLGGELRYAPRAGGGAEFILELP